MPDIEVCRHCGLWIRWRPPVVEVIAEVVVEVIPGYCVHIGTESVSCTITHAEPIS